MKSFVQSISAYFHNLSANNFVRAALILLLVAGVMVAPRQQIAQENGLCSIDPECFNRTKQDLVFLIDRSSSMGFRGETYNTQIDGVIRALRNPSVIPRNGSIAVAVVVFSDRGFLHVPLTEINSNAAAETVANAVGQLKCPNGDGETTFCPLGTTSIATAIQRASDELVFNGRPDARHVLLVSTDGSTSDQDAERAAFHVKQLSDAAAKLGKAFELDVILMGLSTSTTEFFVNKARVDQFVFPQPTSDLPGATFAIEAGDCNVPPPVEGGADAAIIENPDCERQADEFADITRNIIRGNIPEIALVVTTAADTAPGTQPGDDGELSLRQAIEIANCNGGRATITFAENVTGETISPLIPLPGITSPEIVIDGCNGANCDPSVTIDGVATNTAGGEQHDNGILIRSNLITVRGLKIINFPGAGVAIEPVCPFDNPLQNLVELNVLEDNQQAGIVVRDDGAVEGFSTNIRNTFSRNEISGSAILIDLGGDGPTPNDEGDGDVGPNELINFPTSLIVSADNGDFNIAGQANGPGLAGALVEIFAATGAQVVEDNLVITGVTFVADAIVDAEGAFEVEGVSASPTGIYTATLTDPFGNTSELMFASNGTRPAVPAATVTQVVNFGEVQVNQTSDPQIIQIINTGTAPLTVSSCALAVCNEGDRNDTARFALNGCPNPAVLINPGQQVGVNATFTPNACGAALACAVFGTNDPLLPQARTQLTGTGTGLPEARVTLEGGGSALELKTVTPRAKLRQLNGRPPKTFTIQNTGCADLELRFQAIRRTGSDVDNGRITDPDDRSFFFVSAVNADSSETPINVGSATAPSIIIAPGQSRAFRARFNPTTPPVVGRTSGLSANQVLPDVVTSQIVINQVGLGPLNVNLIGRVRTLVRMIDPNNTRNAPVITFSRSGDEFSVDFSAFDSDLSIERATYQFFDGQGRQVGPLFNVDLTQAIIGQQLVRGQSFTVTQKFFGAADNPQVTGVRVTVFDISTSASGTSN